MDRKSDWMGIMPQCCDPAGRWAHVTLQSNENYRTSSQTSTMTNQGSRTNAQCNTENTGTCRNSNTKKTGVAKNHQTNKTFSKSRGISDWVAIKPQYRDPAGRWEHKTVQSNEKYRSSRQTSTLTNQGSRNKVPLQYQEHGDRLRDKQAKQTITDTDPKKLSKHSLKVKDFEQTHHCDTKTTGRNTNTSNKTGVAKNHQTNKSCSKSRGIWLSGYQATVSRSRNKVPL